MTVHGRNDNPHGVADQFFTDEDTLIALGDVLENDIDVEGDPLSMTATPGAGSAGGLFSLDEMGALVFNPNGDFADLRWARAATPVSTTPSWTTRAAARWPR